MVAAWKQMNGLQDQIVLLKAVGFFMAFISSW